MQIHRKKKGKKRPQSQASKDQSREREELPEETCPKHRERTGELGEGDTMKEKESCRRGIAPQDMELFRPAREERDEESWNGD